jgi:hypothetical protein
MKESSGQGVPPFKRWPPDDAGSDNMLEFLQPAAKHCDFPIAEQRTEP